MSREITVAELASCNGADEKPVYLSVRGQVSGSTAQKYDIGRRAPSAHGRTSVMGRMQECPGAMVGDADAGCGHQQSSKV